MPPHRYVILLARSGGQSWDIDEEVGADITDPGTVGRRCEYFRNILQSGLPVHTPLGIIYMGGDPPQGPYNVWIPH